MAAKPKDKAKGALATDPKFVVSDDPTQRARQQRKWELLAKQGDKAAKANLAAIKAYQVAPTAAAPDQAATEQYQGLVKQGGDAQSEQFKQIEKQGEFAPQTIGIGEFNFRGPEIQQFNPGDFQQQFQGAYDSALNQFNRSSEPAFAKQKADFDQMVAERGIDPTSQQYKEMYKARISDPQETARLNAQDAAYQAGLGAQQQAYGQSSNTYGQNLGAQGQQFSQYSTGYGQNLNAQGQQFGQAQTQYQMPFQNLSALSPYFQAQYGQQMAGQSQEYAKELAALQQKYTMDNAKFAVANRQGGGGGGGGGGGLSLQDQMALQNNAFYNNMVLGGLAQPQQQMPGVGNSALNGFAGGVAAGIGAGLTR